MSSENQTVRRLTLTVLERMPWEIDDVRTDLLDYCLTKMISATETSGLRSLCIKLAGVQCRHFPELTAELMLSLDELSLQPLPPGVACSCRNERKMLK